MKNIQFSDVEIIKEENYYGCTIYYYATCKNINNLNTYLDK